MKKTLNYTVTVILALVMIFSSVCFTSCSGAGNPPPLSDVYDRIVYLIEKSYDVNRLFFGEGLPVYARDSEYANLLGVYTVSSYGYDEYVSTHAKFLTIEDMKTAAENVYCSSYLASVYETVFTGVAMEDSDNILYARYSENNSWIYQNSKSTTFDIGMRVYDYSSMRIVMPSYKDSIFVEIDSYSDIRPDSALTVRLSLVWENDNWFLASPTY